jgi:ABC-type antimicrobial peptide transport system permease subunit
VYFGASEGYLIVGAEPQVVAKMSRGELAQYVNGLRGTPDLFQTLGVRLLNGRSFSEAEVVAQSPVAVVGRSIAMRTFGRTDVLGRTLFVGVVPHEVIGVAEDTDAGSIGKRDRGFVYLPFAVGAKASAIIVARASEDPARIVDRLRAALRSVDPGMPIVEMTTGAGIVNQETLFNRVAADTTVLLGVFTLVLALVGLAGLLAYLVSSRRREIGVRMALGARPGQVVRMILLDGLRPVFIGSFAGLLAGGLLSFVLSTVLLRRAGLDVTSLFIVPLVLLPAAGLACYIPARVAARVDPYIALRDM